MLKISEETLGSFQKTQNGGFRKRALAYVYNRGIVRPDASETTLNKVLRFTEEYSSDAAILAEQSRLTMFVLGIQHGRPLFFMDEVMKFMTDTRIPERIKVRKLIEVRDNRLQENV
ncbi:hypothetical protein N9M10_05000 [Hellea sp.]|nr:hypothetical protein [Hellea sp.]